MKIRTEISEGAFIITCTGPTLDASLVQEFIAAMHEFLSKSALDILLDMSPLKLVDSTGLRSVARALKELDPIGNLIICGVERRTLELLSRAGLEDVFIQESNRKTALSHLFWKKKETKKAPTTSHSKPIRKIVKQGQDTLDKIAAATLEEETTFLWEVAEKDFEEIEDEEYCAKQPPPLTKLKAEKTLAQPMEDRRRYRRISHRRIMDGEFMIYCKNMATGKYLAAIVQNISPGGLLINSRSKLTIGDEFLLEGRIGRHFKFKEQAISRSSHNKGYGMEFVNLSAETNHFLSRLT